MAAAAQSGDNMKQGLIGLIRQWFYLSRLVGTSKKHIYLSKDSDKFNPIVAQFLQYFDRKRESAFSHVRAINANKLKDFSGLSSFAMQFEASLSSSYAIASDKYIVEYMMKNFRLANYLTADDLRLMVTKMVDNGNFFSKLVVENGNSISQVSMTEEKAVDEGEDLLYWYRYMQALLRYYVSFVGHLVVLRYLQGPRDDGYSLSRDDLLTLIEKFSDEKANWMKILRDMPGAEGRKRGIDTEDMHYICIKTIVIASPEGPGKDKIDEVMQSMTSGVSGSECGEGRVCSRALANPNADVQGLKVSAMAEDGAPPLDD